MQVPSETNKTVVKRNNSVIAAITMLGFIVIGGWFAISNTIINSDMQQFLPANSDAFNKASIDPVEVINIINTENSGLFLLAIEGGNEQERASASSQLRNKLLKNKKFIFINNGSGKLSKKEKKIITNYRYVLTSKNDSNDLFTKQNLQHNFSERYQELISPLGLMVKKTLRQDPTAEVRDILKNLQQGKEPTKRKSVWFSGDGGSALLIAGIHIKGANINTQQIAVNIVEKEFSKIANRKLKLLITGTGFFAVQARDKIKEESQRISLVASIGVMLIMFLAFRSVWYVLLAVVPLLSAIISGVLVTQAIFGSIQGITLAFGLTLIGVALDYPVHVFSHIVNNENIRKSVLNIWPTMRLGALTTSLGFVALTQTSFNGLAQLGIFAMSGIITAAIITRYILPELILFRPVKSEVTLPAGITKFNKLQLPFNFKIVIIIIGLCVVLIYKFPIVWENDLIKLSPISSEQIKIDARLRKQLGVDDLVNILIIKGNDSNSVIRKSENLAPFLNKLIEKEIIKSYRAPHHFLPSIEKQKKRQQALPETSVLQQRVTSALPGSHFHSDSFNVFINDVEKNKQITPLNKQDLSGTLLGRQLSSMMFQKENSWHAVIRFIGVSNSMELGKEIRSLTNDDLFYINIKHASQSIIDDFRKEASNLIAIGMVVIFIALLFNLKSSIRLARVCFIVCMALVFDILLLNILGHALSIFHLISLLLVMGLGLDYSLFFTHPSKNNVSRERTAYGMWVCFGSTALVFGMLAASSIPVLNAIGMTVFIGVSFSFLFATLFSDKSGSIKQ